MLDRATIEDGAPPPALQRARGTGRIALKRRGDRSVLDTLYQQGCAKIRVPKTHGDWLEAVLINTSGGLTGGDHMAWQVDAAPNTHAVVTTQACERIYRSSGGAARIETQLGVDAGARLDWLPQETIVFDRGALTRTLDVEMAEDACFLGLEAVILGREAHGDDGYFASVSDRWRVRRGGTLIHAEAAALAAGDALARDNAALLDGARAYATLCYVARDAERHIERLKALVAPQARAGVSRIGDKLVLRATGRSGYHLRKIVMPAIAALSGAGAVPKLWSL